MAAKIRNFLTHYKEKPYNLTYVIKKVAIFIPKTATPH